MRYVMLMCADEGAVVSDAERSRRAAACAAFADQMRDRGVLLAGEQLHPTRTATTVRCWDGGDIMISDGPFDLGKEQISGVFVVECKDLDEAIDVATKVPAAWYGTMEIRPVAEA